MLKIYEFDAIMKQHQGMDAAYIEFPYDVEKEFGRKGQVKVVASFDGIAYRGSICKMGQPVHWLGVLKEIRRQIGKGPGDSVHVILKEDLEPRTVEVPEDLAAAMSSDKKITGFFNSLSYTNKREYVVWITSAKKTETRERRLAKAVELLAMGVKTPADAGKQGML